LGSQFKLNQQNNLSSINRTYATMSVTMNIHFYLPISLKEILWP